MVGGLTASQLKDKVGKIFWKGYTGERDMKYPKPWKWSEVEWEELSPIWLPPFHPHMTSLRGVRILMDHEPSGGKLMTRDTPDEYSCICGEEVEDLEHWMESCPLQQNATVQYQDCIQQEFKKDHINIPPSIILL